MPKSQIQSRGGQNAFQIAIACSAVSWRKARGLNSLIVKFLQLTKKLFSLVIVLSFARQLNELVASMQKQGAQESKAYSLVLILQKLSNHLN